MGLLGDDTFDDNAFNSLVTVALGTAFACVCALLLICLFAL